MKKHRRLFERPDDPRPLRITARDIAILQNIARFRLVSTTQLAALDGGSAQNVSRSLLALFEHGYVARPLAQVGSRRIHAGSRPTIYGLTRKGARLLSDEGFDIRRSLLDGIDKECGAGWRFIEHTVQIAGFFVGLEIAARARPELRVLSRTEILEDAPKRKRERQVRIEAAIRLHGMLKRSAVVPDALFGLRFNDEEESYFMLELDRGEMPIERFKDPHQTHFAKKLLTYYEANRERLYVDDLAIANFRVATVTTTPERVAQMLNALMRITAGRGSSMFLFTDEAALAATNPFDLEWLSGRGGAVRLTD